MKPIHWSLSMVLIFGLMALAEAGDKDPDQRSLLAKDRIHDPSNRSLSLLQDPARGLKDLPSNRLGAVDWAAALRKGLITPRTGVTGKEPMKRLDSVIIMTNTRNMPHVTFPHEMHTQWLDCSNCHPSPFLPVAKGNAINMNDVLRGKFCGQCHGKVAFSPMLCEKCHDKTHADSPKAWW
ncbi:MAG: hypothetical protein G8237_06305 [Magnetococcales bacterium]|nr:hypothetical protein [Magnetococcales bacterium]